MTAQPATADRAVWLAPLARWGLLTAVVVASLLVTFMTAMAGVSSQPGFGGTYDELLIAAYSPALYRVAMVFDALGWLCMGGVLVIAGSAVRRDAPVRGLAAIAAGVTCMTGVIGAFLRMVVIGDLGRQFVGADGQGGVLSLYQTVELIVGAHFGAGQLTVGLGFIAIGSAALRIVWIPRSIGWLLVLPGVTSLTLLAGEVAFDAFLFPVLLVHVSLLAALGLASARRWWRPAAVTPPGSVENAAVIGLPG